MIAPVLRRLFQALTVLRAVACVLSKMSWLVSEPVTTLLGQDTLPAQRLPWHADLALSALFAGQFSHRIAKAVQGEFGVSLRQGRKVSALIAKP